MIFSILFVLELVLLFFISKKLIKSLALFIFKITKSHNMVINILAIIFLPGTILHELSHLLVAGIMLVPVGEITVLPEIEGDVVKLGGVQIGRVDPFRLTIVGVAPFLLGTLSILGILYFALAAGNLLWWQIILGLYLIFEISNTMFSSKKDIQGTIIFIAAFLVLFLAFLIALLFLRPLLLQNIWNLISGFEPLINFFKKGSIYLLVPLTLDLLLILLTKL